MTARKMVPGHKCDGVTRWVEVTCECGWRSDKLRAQEQAALYEQWRQHVAECAPEFCGRVGCSNPPTHGAFCRDHTTNREG